MKREDICTVKVGDTLRTRDGKYLKVLETPKSTGQGNKYAGEFLLSDKTWYGCENVFIPSEKPLSAESELIKEYDLGGRDEKFYYQFLDRLRSDCKFFLGHGNRQDKFLWARSVPEHIQLMREILAILPEWPGWMDPAKINEFERLMTSEPGAEPEQAAKVEDDGGKYIRELNLSTRATNSLLRAGYRSAGEIVALRNRYDLEVIRNLGQRSIDEILDRLAELGYNVEHLR